MSLHDRQRYLFYEIIILKYFHVAFEHRRNIPVEQ